MTEPQVFSVDDLVIELATGRKRRVTAIIGVGPKHGPMDAQYAWELDHSDWIVSRDAIRAV